MSRPHLSVMPKIETSLRLTVEQIAVEESPRHEASVYTGRILINGNYTGMTVSQVVRHDIPIGAVEVEQELHLQGLRAYAAASAQAITRTKELETEIKVLRDQVRGLMDVALDSRPEPKRRWFQW